jgi:hypothetical protein
MKLKVSHARIRSAYHWQKRPHEANPVSRYIHYKPCMTSSPLTGTQIMIIDCPQKRNFPAKGNGSAYQR